MRPLRLTLTAFLCVLICACGQLDLGGSHAKDAPPDEITDDEAPISVADALAGEIGEKVTVVGYYVGFVNGTSMSQAVYNESTIEKNTNLLLADRPACHFVEECLPVELPQGHLRDSLNTFENPELLGRRILIRGTLASYFRVTGLKLPTAWRLATDADKPVLPPDTAGTEEGTDPIDPVPVVTTFPKILPDATPVKRGR